MSVDVIASNERRAAHGLHRCVFCGKPIGERERYLDLRCRDNGTVWTQRQHLACMDLMQRYCEDRGIDDEDWTDWQEMLAWEADHAPVEPPQGDAQ